MMTETHEAIVSGAFVLWDVGPTDREALLARLTAIDLAKFCPAARSVNASLRKCLGDHAATERKAMPRGDARNDVIVQPHKKRTDGFEVVAVQRGTSENDYTARFSAKVGVYQGGHVEEVEITKGAAGPYCGGPCCGHCDACKELNRNYQTYRREITGSDVGRALVEILNHLHGTCVRTIGGVYFLPEDAVSKWDEVVEAFEAAGPNTVHRVRIVLDDQAIRTVKTAITRELTKRATQLAEELREGNLSDEVVAARKNDAQALRARAFEYEQILNTELSSVHAIISAAETAAASAVAIEEDATLFDAMFA